MARKKQTYTIGDIPKAREVKKVTHTIPSTPKKSSKPKKTTKINKKVSKREKFHDYQQEESKGIVMNNAFAEAFAKAGITKESFNKK